MSQVPPLYYPQTSFSALAELPITTNGLPGAQIDGELSRLGSSINLTIGRLNEIQRDDGKLRDSIVYTANLSQEVLALLAVLGVKPRVWDIATAYAVGDLVSEPVAGVEITGSDVALANGYLKLAGTMNGKRLFTTTGLAAIPASAPWTRCYYEPTTQDWVLEYYVGGGLSALWLADNAPNPAPEFPYDFPGLWFPAFGASLSPAVSKAHNTRGTFLCIQAHVSTGDFAADRPKWALVAAPPEAGDQVVDTFAGNGVTTSFVLSGEPVLKANTQVYVNGVYQKKSLYSITGSVLLFGVAPANLATIEVVSGIPAHSNLVTVSDGAITAPKMAANAILEAAIATGAVTAAKLAANAVGTAAIADGAVTGPKLAGFGITGDKIAPSTITGDKLANNSITGAAIADQSIGGGKLANGSVTPSKLPQGPLSLNGEPTTAAHAATKGYVDTAASAAQAAATAAAATGATAKVNKAGDTMTGPLVMGTAPFELPLGAAPIIGARAWAKITPYFSGVTTSAHKTGTYVRDGAGTITVTITAHGLRTGDKVWLDFTSGLATDGLLTATVLTANTFTVPQAGAAITTSNVTAFFYRIAGAGNVSSVTTSSGTAENLVLNFTVPMQNANYAVLAMKAARTSFFEPVFEDNNDPTLLNTTLQAYVFVRNDTAARSVNVVVFG